MAAIVRPIALVLALSVLLAACGRDEPVRIGFLGGLSGRVADLGISGRNGSALAVELRNRAGGIGGRPVELVVEDDAQDPGKARSALGRLIAERVEAVVGPMTSSVAMATVPLANEAQLLMVSPTVTTTALQGIDDQFLRVIAPTTDYARKSAAYHYGDQGSRRVAVAYDQRNQAYCESWLADYRQAFLAAGGQIGLVAPFSAGDETSQFGELADRLLADQPDSILIIANSVDTAALAQQIRKRNEKVRIATSEWSATERLIELGGRALEGVVVAQFLDRESTNPSYLAFRNAYFQRFGQEPGFAGLAAFDAANVVLEGLAGRQPGQTLKQAILAQGTFPGVQSPIRFDAAGDSSRETYLTVIRNRTFARLR